MNKDTPDCSFNNFYISLQRDFAENNVKAILAYFSTPGHFRGFDFIDFRNGVVHIYLPWRHITFTFHKHRLSIFWHRGTSSTCDWLQASRHLQDVVTVCLVALLRRTIYLVTLIRGTKLCAYYVQRRPTTERCNRGTGTIDHVQSSCDTKNTFYPWRQRHTEKLFLSPHFSYVAT